MLFGLTLHRRKFAGLVEADVAPGEAIVKPNHCNLRTPRTCWAVPDYLCRKVVMMNVRTFVVPLVLGFASSLPPANTARSAAADLEIRRDIEFSRPAGIALHLDAYLQHSQTPSAAVIFVHGGGFVGGDKRDYPRDLLDPLTEKGFSIISVNYRLAPKHPFPAATDDVEAAIAYVKEHAPVLRVDPRRLALLGPSAGGLIVSYVGARHRPENRVAAVVSMFGEHDLVLRASENPCCMDGRVMPRPPGGCLSGGLAALLGFSEIKTPEQEQRLREASAVSYVQRDMPPYLLIHGTRDYGVPFEQSVTMRERMREVGADCTLIGIVGGGHGNWQNLPQWATERQHMVRWLLARTTVH
jgi:alpha-L-fucosidase 2